VAALGLQHVCRRTLSTCRQETRVIRTTTTITTTTIILLLIVIIVRMFIVLTPLRVRHLINPRWLMSLPPLPVSPRLSLKPTDCSQYVSRCFLRVCARIVGAPWSCRSVGNEWLGTDMLSPQPNFCSRNLALRHRSLCSMNLFRCCGGLTRSLLRNRSGLEGLWPSTRQQRNRIASMAIRAASAKAESFADSETANKVR
jgi:hypothetical protein